MSFPRTRALIHIDQLRCGDTQINIFYGGLIPFILFTRDLLFAFVFLANGKPIPIHQLHADNKWPACLSGETQGGEEDAVPQSNPHIMLEVRAP